MVASARRKALAALLVVIAAGVLWYRFSGPNTPSRASPSEERPTRRTSRQRGGEAKSTAMPPRVGLERLDRLAESATQAGTRDVFAFGDVAKPTTGLPATAALPVAPPPTLSPRPAQDPVIAGGMGQANVPTKIQFIGAVQATSGVWVAALLTESKEVVTGKEGDTVAQRYRVAHIGIESVDLVDLISGREHRIRLGGK